MTAVKASADPFLEAVEEIETLTRARLPSQQAASALVAFSLVLDLLPRDIIEVRLMTAVRADDNLAFPTVVSFPGPLLKGLLAALRTGGIVDVNGHFEGLFSRFLSDRRAYLSDDANPKAIGACASEETPSPSA